MIRHLAFMRQQARHKLTRLGRALFYCYLILAGLGILGGLYTALTLMQKLFMSEASFTPWWEILSLGVSSWLMVRLFHREAKRLLEADPPPAADVDFEATTSDATPEVTASNVIPFNRKSAP